MRAPCETAIAILDNPATTQWAVGRSCAPGIGLSCYRQLDSALARRYGLELNGPVRILDGPDKLKKQWIAWKTGHDVDTLLLRELRQRGPSEVDRLADEFEQLLLDAIGNPTLALELLRQMTICSSG